MKRKFFFNLKAGLWLLALSVLFSGCLAGEQLSLFSDNDISSKLDYEWREKTLQDTLFVECQQTLTYYADGKEQKLYPKAYFKLYVEKETLEFSKNEQVGPRFVSQNSLFKTSGGTAPVTCTERMAYAFSDGQKAIIELSYQYFTFALNGESMTFNHVVPKVPEFKETSFSPVDNEADLYEVLLSFSGEWEISDKSDFGTKELNVKYQKHQVQEADNLLSCDYEKGVDWTGENLFCLYVEKVESWSVSGEKKYKYQAPALEFYLTKPEDKSLQVTNFNFTGTLTSALGKKDDISSEDWTLKKGTATQTVNFTNGEESFADSFEYPAYEASLELDGKSFDFDLSVNFKETHQISLFSESSGQNLTSATASFLEHSFTQEALTSFSKESSAPEPEPDPEPQESHGKVISFFATAVFDPAEINGSGEIAKKCVIVRYEQGYVWGICALGEAFPTSFSYLQSGYSGFNSAAKSSANSDFRPARAVDKSDGIFWYAEDNSLIAAVDMLTCMTFGWQNVVNGAYSSVIDGYQAQYSDDGYNVIVVAPNGEKHTFSSFDD